MTWLLRWKRRLSALFDRDRVEASMDEEMRIHVEMEAEHLVRRIRMADRSGVRASGADCVPQALSDAIELFVTTTGQAGT